MAIRIFLLLILLVGPTSLSGSERVFESESSQEQVLNEVDFRVKGVGLGSSYAAVLRRFGKPLAIRKERVLEDGCGGPPFSSLRLKYRGLAVRLDGDIRGRGFQVVEVKVDAARWPTTPIRLGMTEKEVRDRVSSPWDVKNESGFLVWVYVTKGNDGGVVLYFSAGRLVKVEVIATLC